MKESALILHCADLHLSREEEGYGLEVLAEIVETARRERAALLLFAGDTFDSHREAVSLRTEFRRLLAPLEGFCPVLLLPGNHEELQSAGRGLEELDLGPARLLSQKPFSLLNLPPFEVLAIPHQVSYQGYWDWPVPAKKLPFRIGLAHGIVAGLSYAGPAGAPAGEAEEEGGAAIDPDLFRRFQVDYAALGHIHGRRSQLAEGCLLSYPGSARVWRRGESGERGILSLRFGGNGGACPQPSFLPLVQAGQYRELSFALSLDGGLEGLDSGLEEQAREWGPHDWVRIILSGIVENENAASELESRLERALGRRVRRFEMERGEVSSLPGISQHPLARRFLQEWQRQDPGPGLEDEKAVWLRARQLGLEEIKKALEARG